MIYHDKCADGIVAAWACWKRWGDQPAYRAANYGYEPPADVDGKNILIVDFSYPAEQLLGMTRAGATSIVILDHHKTAEEALAPFHCKESHPGSTPVDSIPTVLQALRHHAMPPIVAIFDMERSGARMAWDFAMGGRRVPEVVRLAERYDLWRFTPGTKDAAEALHLTLQAQPLTVANVNAIHGELQCGHEPVIRGQLILAWRQQLVEEIASRAHLRTVAGVEGVISVECPYSLVSAVGHHLLDKHPTAPFAAMSVTGEKAVTWSLRSHDDRADVSTVAKSMGGGGHRNAAGFRSNHDTPATDTEKLLPANLAALERSIASVDEFMDSDEGHMLTPEHGESIMLCMHELKRLRSLATPAADEVEAVARAIQDEMFPGMDATDISYRGARAAIAAMQARSTEPASDPCKLPADPAGEEPVATTELIERVRFVSDATGTERWKIANLTGHDWRCIVKALEAQNATPTNPERLVERKVRAPLRKAIQFLDLAAGEGLHYQAAGETWDAGGIMCELAEACDIADPEASLTEPLVDAILSAAPLKEGQGE